MSANKIMAVLGVGPHDGVGVTVPADTKTLWITHGDSYCRYERTAREGNLIRHEGDVSSETGVRAVQFELAETTRERPEGVEVFRVKGQKA